MADIAQQSKNLVNVFKEARAAYLERKGEIVASRSYDIEEKRERKALKGASGDDKHPAASRTHPRSHHGSHKSSTHHRHSGNSMRSHSGTRYPGSEIHHLQNSDSPQAAHSQHFSDSKPEALMRRHSNYDIECDNQPERRLIVRSMTSPVLPKPEIDMDLAYGPIPPPLPVACKGVDEQEFKGLVQKVKRILEEADCLQYSASAIILSLQHNPDAMAAVALTLAEISNLMTKVAPRVLAVMKGSSPAVFSLLASPQFLIAGGLAVGVTIVAFGGFKIIKKIRAKNSVEVTGMDEMIEINGSVNRINEWRRGIAEEQERSNGTSVEGEFITPHAAALSRLNLEETKVSGSRRKPTRGGSRKPGVGRTATDSKVNSTDSSKGLLKTNSKASSNGTKKEKTPSSLRAMFG